MMWGSGVPNLARLCLTEVGEIAVARLALEDEEDGSNIDPNSPILLSSELRFQVEFRYAVNYNRFNWARTTRW